MAPRDELKLSPRDCLHVEAVHGLLSLVMVEVGVLVDSLAVVDLAVCYHAD